MVITSNGIFDVRLDKELQLTDEKIEGNSFKFKIYDVNIDISLDNNNLNIKLEQAYKLRRFFLLMFSIMDYLHVKNILVQSTDNSYTTHRSLLYVGFNYDKHSKMYSFVSK